MKRKSLADRAVESSRRKYGSDVLHWHSRIAYARGYVAGWRAAMREKRR